MRSRFYVDHARVQLDTGEETLVQQAPKEETNINAIMAKYRRTGLLEHVKEHQGQYGDFTRVPDDYHGALVHVARAKEMFQTVPADIRALFDNDVGSFLDFAQDPANEEEMRTLGLLPSKMAAKQPPARAPEGDGTVLAADITGRPVATPEGAPEAPPATPEA